MAQKAKTTTKPKTASRSAAKKTPSRSAAVTKTTRTVVSTKKTNSLSIITPQALVGEALGTMGLALVALMAPSDQPLLVGLSLAVLLVGLIRITGGHFNPAVTFGLWAANKVEGIKVPFYWLAQFIGALLAFIIVGSYNGTGANLDLSSFASWDSRTFFVELIATALFLFGLVATVKNVAHVGAKSAGIGLALVLGLVVGGGLLSANATREQTAVQSGEAKTVSRTFAAQAVSVNPAIALAQTQRDVDGINASISGTASDEKQKTPIHLTLSVIYGTLVGAAVGANLYLLLAGVSWKSREI